MVTAVPRDILIDGKSVRRHCVEINGQTFTITGGPLSFATLDDALFQDVKNPEAAIAGLIDARPRPDILTFSQRVPDVEVKFPYALQWGSFAVLPISTYEHWLTKQLSRSSRNKVRKSEKAGVELRVAEFDNSFIRGMVEIFNESPVRQGRPFWHYGKDFETVKREFSRYLFREDLIGAYYGGELIGFVMLANAGRFGVLGQIISKMAHRDKGTNNALIGKTVEVCAQRQLRHLLYTDWRDTTLVDFKRYCGFEEMKLPRYFVPLTPTGRLALRLGLERFHEGVRAGLPKAIRDPLKMLRKRWYDLDAKSPGKEGASPVRNQE